MFSMLARGLAREAVPAIREDVPALFRMFASKTEASPKITDVKTPIKETAKDLPENPPSTCKVVYDGSCPVCKTVEAMNLGKNVELVNARNGHDATVKSLEAKGYDLDGGMAVVKPDGKVLYGKDAVTELGRQQGGMVGKFLSSKLVENNYSVLRGIRNMFVDKSIAEQRALENIEASANGPKLK